MHQERYCHCKNAQEETAAFIRSTATADTNNIHGATKLGRYNAPRNTICTLPTLTPFLSLRRKHISKHGEIVVNIWVTFTKRSASLLSSQRSYASHFRAIRMRKAQNCARVSRTCTEFVSFPSVLRLFSLIFRNLPQADDIPISWKLNITHIM